MERGLGVGDRAEGSARAGLATRLREWAPPVLVHRLRQHFGSVRWTGDYGSWADAMAASQGYASEDILARVERATSAVREGRAAYERDGVAFDRVRHAWPVLASLLWIASLRGGRLHVLDFGGALGTSYRQHKAFLGGLGELHWSVVEQPHFVTCGRRGFEDDNLRFYEEVEACLREARRPDVALLSSVLPYLQAPYTTLDSLLALELEFLIVDRTPFIDGPRDRLTVQRVSRHLGDASYPAWFFSRQNFDRYLAGRYRVVEEFEGEDSANVRSRYRGLLLQRCPGRDRAR